MGLMKPQSLHEKDFLIHLNNAYNFFCSTHENTLIEGMKPETQKLNDVCEMNRFEHLNKCTCFNGLWICMKYASQTTRKWFSQFKKNLMANWKLFSNAAIKVNALQNKISQPDLSFE